jgi:lipopolysaccharide/colanic/teichoic acid biosynthesis glycosyltransferase
MYETESSTDFKQAQKDDPRITKVGKLLRRTSLDELPQLFNVINRSMSIVGPRPHPVKLNEQHRLDISRYMHRHATKPGITGLAQINGFRGETNEPKLMEQRVKYDLEYIRTWSIFLDLKVLALTYSYCDD